VKAVLISIQPKWCELIANGKKTVEVRKTKPKLETPFKVYIYMTKAYDTLFGYGKPKKLCVDGGKVIGEFVCDKICEFEFLENGEFQYRNPVYIGHSCLTYDELINYIGENKIGYGWHISKLLIYDKPKELSEFYNYDTTYNNAFGWAFSEEEKRIYLKRPPQSWCYVERSDNNGE
jgi:predicted transcriptional regulator